ncbi:MULTISPECIES: EAL domain-containing protein [Rahnella]|jgi:sensor c-di-GMP phosphodiesterase-like protein|uniref:cyclic-guanylate-specific phosphodiesterase n=1 Tax=Rahnella sp. (strain Y9602) TaxID=2703885 RepID=A0A0H3FBD5_RAHSY|nr:MULTISPECIES: EAL domain-containing protein [Rahnella]AFE59135.1 diguanylate phosphodiesterase [Rahnella aquatilis HX2]AYA07721.1 cyclic diguanylate phosphodiesterase [Rahnella aquatilis]ADW74491.1 diguanylate phosphodiesterase [Rahnella aceris]AZP42915.1 EAL domain-containing protein [Rahnella aquatilis]AZP47254.1 EAL domain-containing protein [Rahnella aquatilis]
MLFSQTGLAKYRYYRIALASAMGICTLLLTLGIRIYEQAQVIAEDQKRVAVHTVEKLEKLLEPASPAGKIIPFDQTLACKAQQPLLQQTVARMQTLRSISLVSNGTIVCSSLVGTLDLNFNQTLPSFAQGKTQLELRASKWSRVNTPTLVLWHPTTPDNLNGELFVYNIGILSNFLLEPQPPYASHIVLNVGQQNLEYGKNSIINTSALPRAPLLSARSEKYDFAVSIYGEEASTLAWEELFSHLPLSVLISLLTATAIYLFSGSRISLAYPISHGISHREFKVYCQPIINSTDGRCIGVETLMRWKNRRQEWVSPDVFIPLAEQHGLIIALTRYLIQTVAENLSVFPATPGFYVSINVAAQHFNNMEIVDDIRKLWLPAQPSVSLMLELTERTRLQELRAAEISQLKEMGILLAIDDFGTGHSSLSYLKTLNPDVLKIDQAFTASIGTDAINATVTDTIITLAQRLNLKLIAEGVETREQVDYLRERRVDSLQGYYFARPMPIEVFPIWLERYKKTTQNMELQDNTDPV